MPEPFVHAFTEKLATYATRRAMSIDDAAHLQAIRERSKSSLDALRDLMMNFILFDLFIKR